MKAENRYKLGLTSESIIGADEAVERALFTFFGELDSPLPSDRREALRIMRERGLKVRVNTALHLSELRKKAERSPDNDDVGISEAEEAISTAEELLTKIDEAHTKLATSKNDSEFITPVSTPDLIQPFRSLHEGIVQVEPEFVTKLLLARAILSAKKKKIPHIIGIALTVLLGFASALFGLLGVSGIVQTFTGGSLFSIFELVFDFVMLAIAYFFLRLAVYVRGETR